MVLATGEVWLFLLQFPFANLATGVLFAGRPGARTRSSPRLAAEVVAHRFFQRATWLWAGIFLLLTAGLAVLMTTEPVGTFLKLSTVTTVMLMAAGTGASALWFRAVLRRLGLRLRFVSA